jgi:hypothetical protein
VPLSSRVSASTRPFDHFDFCDHQTTLDVDADALADIFMSTSLISPPVPSPNSTGLQALSIAEASSRQRIRDDRKNPEPEVLHQMQRHVAIEVAAKRQEYPTAEVAEDGSNAADPAGCT